MPDAKVQHFDIIHKNPQYCYSKHTSLKSQEISKKTVVIDVMMRCQKEVYISSSGCGFSHTACYLQYSLECAFEIGFLAHDGIVLQIQDPQRLFDVPLEEGRAGSHRVVLDLILYHLDMLDLLVQLGSFRQHLREVTLPLLQLQDAFFEFAELAHLPVDLLVLCFDFPVYDVLVNCEEIFGDVLPDEDESHDEVVAGVVLAFVALDELFVAVGDEVVLHQLVVGFAVVLVPYVLIHLILISHTLLLLLLLFLNNLNLRLPRPAVPLLLPTILFDLLGLGHSLRPHHILLYLMTLLLQLRSHRLLRTGKGQVSAGLLSLIDHRRYGGIGIEQMGRSRAFLQISSPPAGERIEAQTAGRVRPPLSHLTQLLDLPNSLPSLGFRREISHSSPVKKYYKAPTTAPVLSHQPQVFPPLGVRTQPERDHNLPRSASIIHHARR